MKIEELSNKELYEIYSYYFMERLPKGAKISKMAHGTSNHEVTCIYTKDNKQYFTSEIIPERLR